ARSATGSSTRRASRTRTCSGSSPRAPRPEYGHGVTTVVDLSTLALSERAWRFDGKAHGSQVSFFITAHEYGAGPDLHTHPYEETFIVKEGAARFTVDGQAVDASA